MEKFLKDAGYRQSTADDRKVINNYGDSIIKVGNGHYNHNGSHVYGDSNFNDTYFGVSNAGSAASGLPFHDAESGLVSFSIQPMIAYHLNEKWHIGAGLRYMRLTGDAADSPIVDDRGDENQFIGGIGVVYTWGAKVNKN